MLDGMMAGVLLRNLTMSDLGVALWSELARDSGAIVAGTVTADELRRLGLEKEHAAVGATDQEAGG